jgi:homoserine O-acetyltransferase
MPAAVSTSMRAVFGALLLPVAAAAAQTSPPTVASLESCRLTSGAVVKPCRVAYRTYGTLDADRSNVVVVPTYFGGKSEDHAFMLGTYVDTTRFHVIVIDALADGHSSSPSNSGPAGRKLFAGLTIGDMVDVQHRLLREKLGITRAFAVVGISMGGFQAFEWAVRYPEFAERVVPIVGTPTVTAYDQLVYAAMLGEAEHGVRQGVWPDSAWMQLSRIEMIWLRTPGGIIDSGGTKLRGDVAATADYYRKSWKLEDYAAQVRALLRHDVAAPYGGDVARAAGRVRARMLVVYSPDDHMVASGPAAEFARLVGAERLEVRSICGHSVFWCEAEKLGGEVRAFLARGAAVSAGEGRSGTR